MDETDGRKLATVRAKVAGSIPNRGKKYLMYSFLCTREAKREVEFSTQQSTAKNWEMKCTWEPSVKLKVPRLLPKKNQYFFSKVHAAPVQVIAPIV